MYDVYAYHMNTTGTTAEVLAPEAEAETEIDEAFYLLRQLQRHAAHLAEDLEWAARDVRRVAARAEHGQMEDRAMAQVQLVDEMTRARMRFADATDMLLVSQLLSELMELRARYLARVGMEG